jgi:hypothetical protein
MNSLIFLSPLLFFPAQRSSPPRETKTRNTPQAANGGTLPPPEVLRLLLASPAGDLDDVLAHPAAGAAAVARLAAAFERGGAEALGAAELPRLTWSEMQEVQAWREGREAVEAGGDEGGVETRALEGEERRRELPAPAAAEEEEEDASAAARSGGDSGSESELDLDALDF